MNRSKEPVFYLNGRLVSDSNAKVTVRDRCFLYGDGIYDTFVVWNRWPYKLDDHIKRMLDSMRILMMPSPLTEDEMKRALFITIDANKMKYGYIRFQISRGVGLLSDKWNELESGPNCVIIPYDVFIRKELMLHAETGYTAATTTTRKIPVECLPSAVKHCNYLNNIFGAIERTKAGADIGIMLGTDGYVREGIMYTVFFVKDNIIFTPALRNILPSVTRKSIIGLAQEDGYQVIEKDNIELSSLYLADEIFICSVSKSCLSIIELDRRVIGDGQVGPISKRIRQLLFADMDREAEKYDHKNIIGV